MVCSHPHRNGRPFVLSFRVIARLLSGLRNSLLLDQSKSWVSFVFCTTSCGNMVGKCHFYMYYRGLFTQGRKRSLFSRYELKWQCTQKNTLVQTFGRECTVKEWVSKKANWTSLIVYIPPFANFFGIIDGNQLQIIDPKIPFRRYICHLFTFFILIW